MRPWHRTPAERHLPAPHKPHSRLRAWAWAPALQFSKNQFHRKRVRSQAVRKAVLKRLTDRKRETFRRQREKSLNNVKRKQKRVKWNQTEAGMWRHLNEKRAGGEAGEGAGSSGSRESQPWGVSRQGPGVLAPALQEGYKTTPSTHGFSSPGNKFLGCFW